MNNKIIDGLVVDRAVVSIKEIMYQCYKHNPDLLNVIKSEVECFVESLITE